MLRFTNLYPDSTIWVALLQYHHECPGPDSSDWKRKGWWSLAYGQSKTVYGGNLAALNRYYFFYAEADDGTVWTGPYTRAVTNQIFDLCDNDNTNCNRSVGFQLLDIGGSSDFTVQLLGPSNAPFYGKTWKWSHTIFDSGTIEINSSPLYTVKFDRPNVLSVKADCNSGGGTYQKSGNRLKMTITAMTRVSCPPPTFGVGFVDQLSHVTKYSRRRDELGDILVLRFETGTMTFRL